MDLYDKSKIGKKIANGGDRKVYMYDTDKVIKFSSLTFLGGNKLHNKYNHDYLICKKYFQSYIVETTDVSDKSNNKHIEIQPFIQGEMLQKKHTTNPRIQSQLKDILQGLDKMKNDNSPLIDLVGNIGMIKPYLSNIIVDSYGKLRIIDTILLEGKTLMPVGLLFKIIIPIVIARQNYLLRQFLK